jgi:hypothetical protein
MAGQEFQYISDILKEFYTPAIINQLWKKSVLWAMLKKKTQDMVGKQIVTPVRVGLTEAVGARAANDYTLPTAQRNLYDQSIITMKRIYGRVQVDGFSIESAKGKGGWIDVLQGEIQGVTDAFTLDIDRQLLCGGKSVLGQASGANAAQVIPVDAPGGIAADTPLEKFFRKGQVIDIIDSTPPTLNATAVQISSVDTSGHTITVVGTITNAIADNDVIYKANTYHATADSMGEMMGIDGIVNTAATPGATNFQGIPPGTELSWQAMVNTTGGVLSETLIQQDLDTIDNNTDGESVDMILTTQLLRNKLIALMQSLRKIDTLDLVAGWKAIKYVGGNTELPVITHKLCPTKYMYYLSRPHLTLWVLKNLVWDDKGGGVVKPVAGSDAYEAWFKIYANLGTDCRNAHGKTTNYTAA